jgi:protein-disulfide isomerase
MPSWRHLKNAFDILSTALMMIGAGLLIWTQVESRWLRPQGRQMIQDVKGLSIQASEMRYVRGSGPVALIEFTDYQCPFCGTYARDTAPTVDKRLIESNAVRHIVFNFPLESLHSWARKAGEAAECAGQQGRYWDMYARLFGDQKALDTSGLTQSAEALQLDRPRFARCLSGEAANQITDDIARGRRLGVNSTPTFFIGLVDPDGSIKLTKRVNGAVSFDALDNVIHMVAPMKRAQR